MHLVDFLFQQFVVTAGWTDALIAGNKISAVFPEMRVVVSFVIQKLPPGVYQNPPFRPFKV